jgi:glycosyltransferase involved in cell wall biosynthesis
MKTALYTTFYPAAKPYLQAWADSVAAQTDKNVDLWIAVDNIETSDLVLPDTKTHWLHANPDDTPASLRQRAFEEIIQDYDVVIFVDSDDVLLPNRVMVAKDFLKSYDVYGCALNLIDTNGKDTGQIFSSSRTDWTNLLSNYNIFGLSNTAYRTETLAKCLPFPDDTVLVDWLLISRALEYKAHLYFDQTPHMLYRQYSNNTAKVLPPYTPSNIKRATELVLQHYELLEEGKRGRGEEGKLRAHLEQRLLEVQQFSANIADSDVLARYTEALNALKPVFLWWECVANEELIGIWDIGIRS